MRRIVFYAVSLAVIAVLTWLAVPNFVGAGGPCSGAFAWAVRRNMSDLQTLLETYALDWQGYYPHSLEALMAEAQSGHYARDLQHPSDVSCRPLPNGEAKRSWQLHRGMPLSQSQRHHRGTVYVELVSPTRYYLYGTDYDGNLLSQEGKTLVLTND